MRKTMVLIILAIFLSGVVADAYTSGHVYLNGKVTGITNTTITVDDVTFQISPKCRVVIVSKEMGSYHELPARIHDVSRGDWVSVRKIAKTVDEIIIERWRQ